MTTNRTRITSNQEIIDALTPIPKFTNREAIKPWIHEKLEPRGISLVIERSDSSKVVFKCKNNQRKQVSISRKSSQSTGKNGKRVRSVPEDSCPFRLRVSYSVKHKIWAVNIIKHEHNPQLCSNFSESNQQQFSPSSTTPGAIGSFYKRNYSSSIFTPASTVSPAFSSLTDSSFTPASDLDYFDHLMNDHKLLKRQKTNTSTHVESPLYHQVEPLDTIPLLPEDLSDINNFYESNRDINLLNSMPLTNLDTTSIDNLNFDEELSNFQAGLNQNQQCQPVFRLPTQPKLGSQSHLKRSTQRPIAKKPESITRTSLLADSLVMQQQQQMQKQSQQQTQTVKSMNFDLSDLVNDNLSVNNNEDDPLVYLLNTGSVNNSNYTIEELENLDKALGFDDNDKFLMSMFQGM